MNGGSNDKIILDPRSKEFEQLYINLRQHEQRIYSDEEVAWLPEIDEGHIHRKEWESRKVSCQKLTRYLRNKKRPLKILEIGCGNGWLSYQLSQIPSSNVLGLDVNMLELQQAERVFAAISNLRFQYGDIHSDSLKNERFDIIVFAASIQYFNSFTDIIETTMKLLAEKGEIHILDSHFYSREELQEAEKRSREYFHKKGFDRMEEFYFHHSLIELEEFNCTILYDPHSMWNKILKRKRPFHWIRIKK